MYPRAGGYVYRSNVLHMLLLHHIITRLALLNLVTRQSRKLLQRYNSISGKSKSIRPTARATYIHTYIHTYVHAYIYIYIYTFIYIYMYVYMYVCMYVCRYAYIHVRVCVRLRNENVRELTLSTCLCVGG